MTSKKKTKGKTMPLTDFLADDSKKLVTVRATTWSDIVDSEEAEAKPIVVDLGALPTAPRNAHDVDFSTVPNNPPFVAHVANLSFEISDNDLRNIFGDLKPKVAKVIRDGLRSKGVGLVEFETRENLIEALKKTDKEVFGRKIRVNVSDKTDIQAEGGRNTFGNNRSNRGGGGGEERPEMADRWKRADPRSDDTNDDRPSGGFNRNRQNRDDHGRSSMGGNSRDNQHGNDFGFGYPRSKDDRGGAGSTGGRDYHRQGQRNRYQDDDNRSNSGADRPRYSGRYSDTRDTRDQQRGNDPTPDDQREPPRERQRLQLQPRTKPLEEFQPLSGSSSSINNVAAQSSASNPDESSSSLTNTSLQQTQDSSVNEGRDEYQHQESRDSTDSTSRVNRSDEQSTVKPPRGAGASIFGGAKPVDTTARELEIERKLKEMELANTETSADNEEKPSSSPPPASSSTTSSSRPSYNRGGDREPYRNKRSSHNGDYRDRRDEGRSSHGGDYHNRRENNDNRQADDDSFRRVGGGHDRERYSGPPRRDNDSGRPNKHGQQSHPERDNERGNYRQRNQESNDFTTQGRSSNTNFNSESQPRNPQRGTGRRTVKAEDESARLQLSNKFGMLDVDDDDDNNENDDAQSPSIED